jgi:hypothetical protein
MTKKSPISGFIPKLAWAGGIMILALALFLSYFNSNNTSKEQQSPDFRTVGIDNKDISTESADSHKDYLKSRRDAVVDYLTVRNVYYDYLGSKY